MPVADRMDAGPRQSLAYAPIVRDLPAHLCASVMRKAHRLRQAARFQAIRTHGRWWSHPILALGALPNGLGISRCGFSVSKRLGTAVARNRARRRLREGVRLHWESVAPGWDLVFAAREPVRQATLADIAAAVHTLLRRAGLLAEVMEP